MFALRVRAEWLTVHFAPLTLLVPNAKMGTTWPLPLLVCPVILSLAVLAVQPPTIVLSVRVATISVLVLAMSVLPTVQPVLHPLHALLAILNSISHQLPVLLVRIHLLVVSHAAVMQYAWAAEVGIFLQAQPAPHVLPLFLLVLCVPQQELVKAASKATIWTVGSHANSALLLQLYRTVFFVTRQVCASIAKLGTIWPQTYVTYALQCFRIANNVQTRPSALTVQVATI